MLKLAPNLSLPDNAVTQTPAWIGRKGGGKTYAAGKFVEELLKQGAQVVILDPVGVWYGLRLDKSGKKPSQFQLPILGGEHGDVPLDPAAGEIIAQFVVDTGSSVVLDVSSFRKNQRKEFVADFAEEFFHRKKRQRTPVHLVIEEAQVFAPEQPGRGEERMLGAIEDIVRLGRNFGIGCSMISQRPQSVNKEVLNQAEPLVVFQLVASHERNAIEKWMKHVGAELQDMLSQLSKLQPGECYFWSPAWLRRFEKTKFDLKETYDASATPTLGSKQAQPQQLSPVDLEALHKSIQASIEKAQADDPKALKAKVTALEKEIKRLQSLPPSPPVEVPTFTPAERDLLDAILAQLQHIQSQAKPPVEVPMFTPVERELLDAILSQLQCITPQVKPFAEIRRETLQTPPAPISPTVKTVETGRASSDKPTTLEISDAHRRILTSLYWLQDEERTPEKVAFLANYTVNGHFKNMLGQLRSSELVSGLSLTNRGLRVIQQIGVEQRPTGRQLREWFRPKLSECENRILDALLKHPHHRFTTVDLAAAAGYNVSGHFKNMLGHLRTIQLIQGLDRDGGTQIHPILTD